MWELLNVPKTMTKTAVSLLRTCLVVYQLGLGPGPVCTGSATALAEGATRVASVLPFDMHVHTSHDNASYCNGNPPKCAVPGGKRGHTKQKREGQRERGRETVSTEDEAGINR